MTSLKVPPTLAPDSGSAACDRTNKIAPASYANTIGIVVRQLPGSPGELRKSEDTGMPTGTIARLLIDKGFGFIRDESGLEHFFHRSSVRGAVFELLREGQRVEFAIEESQKGPRAGDVRLIES